MTKTEKHKKNWTTWYPAKKRKISETPNDSAISATKWHRHADNVSNNFFDRSYSVGHVRDWVYGKYSITVNQFVIASVYFWRDCFNFTTWNSCLNSFFVRSVLFRGSMIRNVPLRRKFRIFWAWHIVLINV